jgi:enamine deaminase RidA (YjgF/YER057c/UK114 family)
MLTNRRSLGKWIAATLSLSRTLCAQSIPESPKKVHYRGGRPEHTQLYSSAVSYNGLLFLAGKGAHFPGDIKTHTKFVLDEIDKELTSAGSSMKKVLKANVFLNDINDYAAMNEIYLGRFGEEPPARTTVAPMGGIPNGSLVEIEVIAFI